MKNRTSSSASHPLKILPPLPPGFPEAPDVVEGSDIELPLMGRKSPSAESTWSADAADLFVLLCSFLLTTISIVLVALVFHTQSSSISSPIPYETLSILQRAISALSVAITSAVIMVAGKRYVLFKLARGGLRSRRVAVYGHLSFGNLARYLLLHGAELPLLGLLAVGVLALVTGLTVNNSWVMGSISGPIDIAVPSGPFDPATPGSSWVIPASEQLIFVMSSMCSGVAGAAGLINVTNANIATEYQYPMGIIYYPPRPHSLQNVGFSFSTTMNGFNISMEQLSLVPSTARNLTCAQSAYVTMDLWSDGSDDQTLSIIVVESLSNSELIYRFNATAIIMGGTLSSSGNYTEFALNGTSWPNVMPAGNQWAQDITDLICNTSSPSIGTCFGSSFWDFANNMNTPSAYNSDQYSYWSTILSMAIGAYSSAMYPYIGYRVADVSCTQYGVQFTSHYGIYILILNIVMSVTMLVIVMRLRLLSHLGADFINPTRLLLDPLKKPELFNASLETTVDVLGDPYMFVEDSAFLLCEQKVTGERRKRIGRFALRWRHWRNPFNGTP